jgi:hypothetical protein
MPCTTSGLPEASAIKFTRAFPKWSEIVYSYIAFPEVSYITLPYGVFIKSSFKSSLP